MEFFLNAFTKCAESSGKNCLQLKELQPATSCVRDQDATIVPARHIRFPDFIGIIAFNESSAPIRKISNKVTLCRVTKTNLWIT